MASIAHLPVELTLSVIDHLRPLLPSLDTGEALMSKSTLVEHWNSGAHIFNEPQEDSDHRGILLAEETWQSAWTARKRAGYSDLISLRQ
jgi:hypothetical protein